MFGANNISEGLAANTIDTKFIRKQKCHMNIDKKMSA